MANIIQIGDYSYEIEDDFEFQKENEEEKGPDFYKCWVVGQDGSLTASGAVKTLEPGGMKPGVWSVQKTQSGYSLIPEELPTERVVKLPNQEIVSVIEELNRFWDNAEKFEKYGITHKRGILLHGPPGTGKSSIIDSIVKECVAQGGIVFYIRHRNDLDTFIDFAHCELRQLEKDRKILTIIEDIENLANQDMAMLLAFLDGEDEVQHNVVLATTNHIKDLSDILTRQSRFDWIIEINHPTEEDRRAFLKGKYNFEDGELLDRWVKDTEDQSLAALNEMFVAVVLLDNKYEDVLARMKDHSSLVSKSLYKSKSKNASVGFSFGN